MSRALSELNELVWHRLPAPVRDSRIARAYGTRMHDSVRRTADREMYFGTLFLRNRPALELLRQLVEDKEGGRLRIAVLGCSIGAEVYSILWTLRPALPDLEVVVHGVDVSPEVLEYAEVGLYGSDASERVGASIFDRLTEEELEGMFDWRGDRGRIKPWLREGITWTLGDACDPDLVESVGVQDIVVASNFLCHLDASAAETCLRNLPRLTRAGGYLFVSGVDLDIRTRVALDLGWTPVTELLPEMHEGDPLVRADWPWRWWGLEPLDRTRPDWHTRYATAFQVGAVSER